MKRQLTLTLAALLAAGTAMAQEPQPGGVLKIASTSDIRSLDGTRQDANTDAVLHHIFDSLVAYRDDMTVGPLLAESWETSEDGKTWTFTIRDGATYHNGKPVKAEDMVWLWDRLMARGETTGTPWLCQPVFDGSGSLKVNDVSAPDDRTLVFELEDPSPLFLERMADVICHIYGVSPDNVDADGNWIEGSAIGTGPFKLKEWKKEQYVALEKFDDYVPVDAPRSGYAGDRTAYVDEVQFVVVPDSSAAEAAALAGQVDVTPLSNLDRADEMEAEGMSVLSAPGLSLTAVLLQTQDPLLSDVRIRKAIAHAIDLEQLTEVTTSGLTKANPSGVPLSSAYYGEEFANWPDYDVEKAKALLEDAGYDGTPITIQANKRYNSMYNNAVLLQAMLAQAGITAEIEVLDWAAQLDNFFSGNFQMSSFGYSQRTDPAIIYGMFIGDKDTYPTAQWDDPKVSELYGKITSEADFDTRRDLLVELQAKMAQDVPILPLHYWPVVQMAGPDVHGYEAWSLAKPRAWGVWKDQ
ncbi:ABC transporter substrate-binding protein [Chachezhania antarctica]|uniref:ABC transporter substrate-binding protein n=1 Tax=Chachezhania antarctica TaxID=2340860 RepID=UPI000EAF3616|nr:ABC transporter substrate-binding protein [Chachezhania antarctica]|tara:strand:+ start:6984 stop:8552 length:1569 start_codon:yes stop_codon:yes gene_type:complete